MTTAETADLEAAERDAAEADNKPGIYTAEEIPPARYHRIQAIGSHMLQGFYRTPAHAKEAILHPFESSKEQAFGQALHTRVLEPHLFDALYLVPPKVDRRTKAGKTTWAEFEATAGGRTLLEAGDRDRIEDMARAIERHPAAQEMLSAPVGGNEVTVIWDQRVPHEDDYSVVRCKGRLDVLRHIADDTWILDLKTTQDASQRAFERQVAAYNYHMQLGHYCLGLEAMAPAPRRVGFLAVEKERPFAVNLMELDPMDLEQGMREAQAHLAAYVKAMATGIWEAYGDGMGYCGLPEWKREA